MKQLNQLFKIHSHNEQNVVITFQDNVTQLNLLEEGLDPLIKYIRVRYHELSGYSNSVEYEVQLFDEKFNQLGDTVSVSQISDQTIALPIDVPLVLNFLEQETGSDIVFGHWDSMKDYVMNTITGREVKIF